MEFSTREKKTTWTSDNSDLTLPAAPYIHRYLWLEALNSNTFWKWYTLYVCSCVCGENAECFAIAVCRMFSMNAIQYFRFHLNIFNSDVKEDKWLFGFAIHVSYQVVCDVNWFESLFFSLLHLFDFILHISFIGDADCAKIHTYII